MERGEGTLFCSSLRHSSRACDTNLASLSAFIRRPRIRSASVRSNMAACAVVQVPCLRGVTGGTRRTAALPHCRPIRGCRLPTATSSTGMWRTLGDTAASRSYPVRQLREARMGRGTCGGTCGEGATDSAAILEPPTDAAGGGTASQQHWGQRVSQPVVARGWWCVVVLTVEVRARCWSRADRR